MPKFQVLLPARCYLTTTDTATSPIDDNDDDPQPKVSYVKDSAVVAHTAPVSMLQHPLL